jgi:hypothetical protein
MKVKFLQTTSFMRIRHQAGSIVDLPSADADRLIKKGICEKASSSPKKKKD